MTVTSVFLISLHFSPQTAVRQKLGFCSEHNDAAYCSNQRCGRRGSAESCRAFAALLLKGARVGLSSAVAAQAGLGLSRALLPVGCARGMPTFQRTSETSSFYFSHLNGPRAVGCTYWELRARARCVCFRGTGLDVLSCAECEGDGWPRASMSRKTREHGRYGRTGVSGRVEGDRNRGLSPITLASKPSVFRSLTGTAVGTNTH